MTNSNSEPSGKDQSRSSKEEEALAELRINLENYARLKKNVASRNGNRDSGGYFSLLLIDISSLTIEQILADMTNNAKVSRKVIQLMFHQDKLSNIPSDSADAKLAHDVAALANDAFDRLKNIINDRKSLEEYFGDGEPRSEPGANDSGADNQVNRNTEGVIFADLHEKMSFDEILEALGKHRGAFFDRKFRYTVDRILTQIRIIKELSMQTGTKRADNEQVLRDQLLSIPAVLIPGSKYNLRSLLRSLSIQNQPETKKHSVFESISNRQDLAEWIKDKTNSKATINLRAKEGGFVAFQERTIVGMVRKKVAASLFPAWTGEMISDGNYDIYSFPGKIDDLIQGDIVTASDNPEKLPSLRNIAWRADEIKKINNIYLLDLEESLQISATSIEQACSAIVRIEKRFSDGRDNNLNSESALEFIIMQLSLLKLKPQLREHIIRVVAASTNGEKKTLFGLGDKVQMTLNEKVDLLKSRLN